MQQTNVVSSPEQQQEIQSLKDRLKVLRGPGRDLPAEVLEEKKLAEQLLENFRPIAYQNIILGCCYPVLSSDIARRLMPQLIYPQRRHIVTLVG